MTWISDSTAARRDGAAAGLVVAAVLSFAWVALQPEFPNGYEARLAAVEDGGSAAAASAALFVVNRSLTDTQTVRVDVRDLGVSSVREAVSLWDDDVYAKNTMHDQNRVGLRPTPTASLDDGVLTLELPPVSWTGVSLG